MMWIILILSILSGLLYRMGGMGNEGRRDFSDVPGWFFNTKARDIGCSICCGAAMAVMLPSVWWAHFLAFGALFGSLTTYWDELFGYDNHWFHGFACALAYFPYAIAEGVWLGFGVRCIALAILMGGLSALSTDDDVEEIGRGALLVLTLPLLLV